MAFLELKNMGKTFNKKNPPAVDDFSLQADEGDFIVLVGSSGCGKSTTLRLIAGLETPSTGSLLLKGQDITRLPPAERNIAMVFQDFALYPHMTVFDNIAFPLKVRKVSRERRAERVGNIAEMLEITDLLNRKPPKLSGGQKQRVAIGRALVRDPALFLLDEPLSNLDAKLRAQMRGELAKLHRSTGATIIYVTHDQTEAMTLATKIVIMDQGCIQQIGTPDEVYLRPKNRFVAEFMGTPSMNILTCMAQQGKLHLNDTVVPVTPALSSTIRHYDNRPILLGIRPEDIEVKPGVPEEGESKYILGRCLQKERAGSDFYISIECGMHTIIARESEGTCTRTEPGASVHLSLKSSRIVLFDPETGINLCLP